MASNLYTEFCKSAVKFPDRIFIYQCGGVEYQRYSYREIHDSVTTLCGYLSEQGLNRGDRVATLSENRFEVVVCYLACLALGLVVVPLDPKWLPADWVGPLKHATVRLLLVAESLLDRVEGLVPEIFSLRHGVVYRGNGDSTGVLSFENIWDEKRSRAPQPGAVAIDPDDPAAILYTSGTTGRSKGVVLTHENILSSARIAEKSYGCEGDVVVSIIPLNHILGLATLGWVSVSGMSIVLFPKLDLDIIAGALLRIRPHYFVTVPLFLERLAGSIEHRLAGYGAGGPYKWIKRASARYLGAHSDRYRFFKKTLMYRVHRKLGGRLKAFLCGGAPLDPQVMRFFNTLGIAIYEGYGLTETAAAVAVNCQADRRLGSVGRALEGLQTRIDEADAEGIGEICVKGPVVMKGYYRNDEETQKVLDAQAWFHTGDLGRIDKDGFHFITGRKKDLIVTPNGKNVYPEEIEEFFSNMRWVKEVCVFGLARNPNAGGLQEVIHLQIVPDFERAKANGIQDIDVVLRQEVRTLSEALPDYKRPRSIGFSKEPLPRTSTSKVRKNLVKQAFVTEDLASRKKHLPEKSAPQFDGPVGASVARLVRRLTADEVDLSSDSSLSTDLSLDSLTILEFWSHLENAFHVKIPDEVRGALKTLGEVVQYFEALPAMTSETLVAAMDIELKKNGSESWDEILAVESEENRNQVRNVLAKYPGVRPVFLTVFRRFFKHFHQLEIRGLEHVPDQGPFILAPNHESHLDNLLVACQLPRWVQENMVVIGKREHFEQRVTRAAAELCHAVPVDRGNVSTATLQMCAEVLRQGKTLLVHPEGTRSPDGKLLPLKPGVAILAQHLRCPVVPTYIEGAHEFWPKDSTLPKSGGHITVTIGEALHPAPAEKGEASSYLVEQLVRKMTVSLTAMSNGDPGRSRGSNRSDPLESV